MGAGFSRDMKEALSRVAVKHKHCRLAELHALIAGIGTLAVQEDGRPILLLQSENLPAVRRADFLLRSLGAGPDCSVFLSGKGRAPFYSLSLTEESLPGLLKELGFMSSRGVLREITVPAPASMLKNECCRRAFLRGAFLADGYVSDPESAYHMEIVPAGEARAKELQSLLESLGVRSRITLRKGRHLVYIKESEAISDVLSLTGAFQSRLEWENARVYRSIQGQVNRQVNCETANLAKTSKAGSEQAEAIRRLQEARGLSVLPPHLKEIALLRMEHPELSLQELGELLDPPVGKSGVNHRLRKIMEYAAEVK